MRLTQLTPLALCAASAKAFQNSSPFFIFSSVPGDISSTGQFASASQVSSAANAVLGACQADAYVMVQQPHVSAADFGSEDAAPHLRRRLTGGNDSDIAFQLSLPEVFGQVDVESFRKTLQDSCKAGVIDVDASRGIIPSSESYPQIINVNFAALPSSPAARASKLQEHDSFLNAVINNLETKNFITLYTTTPPAVDEQTQHSTQEFVGYESADKFQNAMHIDLKRDLNSHVAARANNTIANVGLFEKYGFLSPGIFMGGIAVLILFLILYVGISAIASLEIPVMAFSKEMGPAAQKKQQQ